ncbi:photosynthetic complex assembly protein PuhC [Tranquillimonas alkanivorans]|uniref:Putative photosynthetic complex assembly protein n=1 Tax=Tranquillimonas alkanivorans TaxID=441119 RepID=A0A1I5LCN1_9RHOB|nr:photosynthetic complex assembly protein PuhC [Tranquillimonas alkanivorans]SFO94933.1 putative photosynthetic complex assembly protein [Tranquillimonas alkanivorans]
MERIEGGLYYDAERREMQARDREMIPTRLVAAMAALALSAVALAAFAVATDRPLVGRPPAAQVAQVVSFRLEGDGNAVRLTAPDGRVLLDTGQGGFVAVVADGLDRARRVHRVAGNPRVTLTRFDNGRLALTDPATGWRAELGSFGPGNRAVWDRVLAER